MKVFQMNENDFVLHNSLEEAIAYYDQTTGVFKECKDSTTGTAHEIDTFRVHGTDDNETYHGLMTVKEAIEKGFTGVPDIYSYEY